MNDLNLGKMHKFIGKNMPMFLIKDMRNPDCFISCGEIVVVLESLPKLYLMKILTFDGRVGFVPYIPDLLEEV